MFAMIRSGMDDLDGADLFVVIGANMADCPPILFLRMMDRVRDVAKLVVVDPRRTATAAKADLASAGPAGYRFGAARRAAVTGVREASGIDAEFIIAYTEG